MTTAVNLVRTFAPDNVGLAYGGAVGAGGISFGFDRAGDARPSGAGFTYDVNAGAVVNTNVAWQGISSAASYTPASKALALSDRAG